MTATDRKIRLYRTLITIGVVLALVSVGVSLMAGTFIPMAFWAPVSYALLAWVLYSLIISIWGGKRSSEEP